MLVLVSMEFELILGSQSGPTSPMEMRTSQFLQSWSKRVLENKQTDQFCGCFKIELFLRIGFNLKSIQLWLFISKILYYLSMELTLGLEIQPGYETKMGRLARVSFYNHRITSNIGLIWIKRKHKECKEIQIGKQIHFVIVSRFANFNFLWERTGLQMYVSQFQAKLTDQF